MLRLLLDADFFIQGRHDRPENQNKNNKDKKAEFKESQNLEELVIRKTEIDDACLHFRRNRKRSGPPGETEFDFCEYR